MIKNLSEKKKQTWVNIGKYIKGRFIKHAESSLEQVKIKGHFPYME